MFLGVVREQDLLPANGTSFACDASRVTLADATDDIFDRWRVVLPSCAKTSRVAYPWLLARVGHSSLGAGSKHIDGLTEFGCRTLRFGFQRVRV